MNTSDGNSLPFKIATAWGTKLHFAIGFLFLFLTMLYKNNNYQLVSQKYWRKVIHFIHTNFSVILNSSLHAIIQGRLSCHLSQITVPSLLIHTP